MAIGTTPVASSQVSISKSAAVTSDTFALGVTPAASDTVFAMVGFGGNTQLISGLTETSVAWTNLANIQDANVTAQLFMGVVSAGAGATVAFNSAVSMATVQVRGNAFEWTGLATTAPSVSQVTGQLGGTGNPCLAPSVTPTPGAECLIISFMRIVTGTFASIAGGFTDITPTGSALSRCAYRYVAAASGSYQCQWTFNTASDQFYNAGSAVFYAPSGGGGSTFKAAYARKANLYIPGQ